MEDEKAFVWTSKLSKRLLQLRFDNDWLFKKNKQPWREFHKILLENGFPKEMTVSHARKKYSYMYETYKIAKQSKNKSWKYYKIFDKHYGKAQVIDKYESWSDEWRLKLVTCISEAKALQVDMRDMWSTVESAMRCQDLPLECCIQDIKGLWHHIRLTFDRKHRMMHRQRSSAADWPLYDTMFEYYQRFDPHHIIRIETLSASVYNMRIPRASKNYMKHSQVDIKKEIEEEFQWTKDITESFIQVRLQNDWLFKERKWAWNDLLEIMIKECSFPAILTGREICRKWATIFSDYQKAKATNNKSWLYYNLFELYLGEGSLSLNPLVGWQEEWILNLIHARIELDHLFRFSSKDQSKPWREVEKRLRSIGLPMNHSLLDLPEMWAHLVKTLRWKRKFASKGILTEQWPYYEAMSQYEMIKVSKLVKKHKLESVTILDGGNDDDYEDDMKLFDLKQKMELQLKLEYLGTNQCRSCSNEEGCVNIFEQTDAEGFNLAHKLRTIGDIEVEQSDNMPPQICLSCLRELESAFMFRRKCQRADKQYRKTSTNKKIKIEFSMDDHENINAKDEPNMTDLDDFDSHFNNDFNTDISTVKINKKMVKKEPPRMRRKKRVKKEKYEYHKVCEICGKHTKNLTSHLDAHSNGKAYTCEVCDKKFKFKSGLIIHRAVHDPTPKKTCEVCGKTFHILAQYRRHFVYHANERKFECDTCGKRFNTIDILKVHIRTHTDERPFSCPECGKTFRTAGCVSRHKRIVHRPVKLQ